MKIEAFQSGPIETNCYLIRFASGKAVLIDAAPESYKHAEVMKKKENFTLTAVLLTHSHFDHMTDAFLFQSKMQAKIYVSPLDAFRMEDPNRHSIWELPFEIPTCRPDGYLRENEDLEFSGIKFRILDTPGHTEGGVSIVCDSARTVFCGDTLFRESAGRTDLPGGDYIALEKSITQKLYTLPDDYRVLTGHGPETTIGYEKENNLYIPKNS